MTASQTQLNRFFVCSDFGIYYRRNKHLVWQNQANSDFTLIGVLSGELHYVSDKKSLLLGEAEAVILEPNMALDAHGKQVEFLLINLAPSIVIQHALTMRLIPPQSTVAFTREPITADQRLQSLLRSFVSELGGEKPGKEIVLRALMEQLIVQILRNHAKPRRSDELELSRVGLIDRRIRRSVELMHTQLDQDLSLKDLAAASYLSTFHFARLFKKLTGSTPHNYLASIRASRAQLLLANGDLSITEVGARVGYLSPSHFTKAFRQATGTTPREFRKALVAQS